MTNTNLYLIAGRIRPSDSGLHNLVGSERIVPRAAAIALIVDDVMFNLELQKEYMERLGFTEIYSAENGVRALEMARKHKPDVTILDTIMPGRYGYEICRDLREAYGSRMVILGNSDHLDNIAHWKGIGADGFVGKTNVLGINPQADCPFVRKLDDYFPKRS